MIFIVMFFLIFVNALTIYLDYKKNGTKLESRFYYLYTFITGLLITYLFLFIWGNQWIALVLIALFIRIEFVKRQLVKEGVLDKEKLKEGVILTTKNMLVIGIVNLAVINYIEVSFLFQSILIIGLILAVFTIRKALSKRLYLQLKTHNILLIIILLVSIDFYSAFAMTQHSFDRYSILVPNVQYIDYQRDIRGDFQIVNPLEPSNDDWKTNLFFQRQLITIELYTGEKMLLKVRAKDCYFSEEGFECHYDKILDRDFKDGIPHLTVTNINTGLIQRDNYRFNMSTFQYTRKAFLLGLILVMIPIKKSKQ